MDIQSLPADFNQGMKILQDNLPFLLEVGTRILSALIILVVGWLAGNWVQRRVTAIKKLDATLTGFFGGFLKYGILAVSMITVLGQFGVQTASLLAVLGAAGLAIGLAMQGTLSNVAAGAMILILRPFNVGDYIQAGGIGGTVKALGLFGTEMATPDNVYIFVPNGKIWGSDIWNYSRHPHRRQDINVGISYGDDIDKALGVVRAVLDAEPRLLRGEEGKEPDVMVSNMGDFSIDLIVRFWCGRSDYWALKWALTKAIKEALDAGGITIPFPTRTLEVRDGRSVLPKSAIQ
ncbi:MAG: mechanosensitive ion channel [Alphaproteobacteria bacterium]|nr:mechanosensitive ion channel [Alphaproteobacteria bacterium]